VSSISGSLSFNLIFGSLRCISIPFHAANPKRTEDGMGIVNDIQKLIAEVGTSSVLRERLLMLKDRLLEAEEEKLSLQRTIRDQEQELSDLRQQLEKKVTEDQFVEHRGALFKRKPSGSYHRAVYCPHCLTSIASMEGFTPFYCERCSFMTNFNGIELPGILEELERGT
jgi:hypothetical protein